jgi:hypothetical protein
MENFNNTNLNKEDYNNIPVAYCKHCLSLKIMAVDGNLDYCDDCGCTDIGFVHINDWELLKNSK